LSSLLEKCDQAIAFVEHYASTEKESRKESSSADEDLDEYSPENDNDNDNDNDTDQDPDNSIDIDHPFLRVAQQLDLALALTGRRDSDTSTEGTSPASFTTEVRPVRREEEGLQSLPLACASKPRGEESGDFTSGSSKL
jgi:hypothetical protein